MAVLLRLDMRLTKQHAPSPLPSTPFAIVYFLQTGAEWLHSLFVFGFDAVITIAEPQRWITSLL